MGELGIEPCQECEPMRPWAPIVISDGSVIVADQFNRRWVLFGADGFAISSIDTGEWSILAQPWPMPSTCTPLPSRATTRSPHPSPARCSYTAWPT